MGQVPLEVFVTEDGSPHRAFANRRPCMRAVVSEGDNATVNVVDPNAHSISDLPHNVTSLWQVFQVADRVFTHRTLILTIGIFSTGMVALFF